jgi:hypothetical protein
LQVARHCKLPGIASCQALQVARHCKLRPATTPGHEASNDQASSLHPTAELNMPGDRWLDHAQAGSTNRSCLARASYCLPSRSPASTMPCSACWPAGREAVLLHPRIPVHAARVVRKQAACVEGCGCVHTVNHLHALPAAVHPDLSLSPSSIPHSFTVATSRRPLTHIPKGGRPPCAMPVAVQVGLSTLPCLGFARCVCCPMYRTRLAHPALSLQCFPQCSARGSDLA